MQGCVGGRASRFWEARGHPGSNPTQLLMRPGKCGYPPDDASVFLFAAVILMMRSQQRPKKKDLRLLGLSFI